MGADALASFIKARRKALGLSQTQLAQRAGMSRGYLTNLERAVDAATGRPNRPGVDKLDGLARALGVSTDELMRLLFDKPAPTAGQLAAEMRYPPTPEEEQLIRAAEDVGLAYAPFASPAFWQRPPQARRHAFRYIEGLVEEAETLSEGQQPPA